MEQQDDVSDTESEAYLGDDAGNIDQQDQEVADLQGAEAGADVHLLHACNLIVARTALTFVQQRFTALQTVGTRATLKRERLLRQGKQKLPTILYIVSLSTQVDLCFLNS